MATQNGRAQRECALPAASSSAIRQRSSPLRTRLLLQAENELLRLKNDLLRAEEARLTEEQRWLRHSHVPMPFASHEFVTYANPIISYEGQMNAIGLAHGWGVGRRANGDIVRGGFSDGLANGLCVIQNSVEGTLLSHFADDCPIDLGIAWSVCRQIVVRLSNGKPVDFIDSPDTTSQLVLQHFGDGSIDLLSSLDPPLTLLQHHRVGSASPDLPRQPVPAVRSPSPTSRTPSSSSLPCLTVPDVNSPTNSLRLRRGAGGSLRRGSPPRHAESRATPNVALPDVRSPPQAQAGLSLARHQAATSTEPNHDEHHGAVASRAGLLVASSCMFERASPSPSAPEYGSPRGPHMPPARPSSPLGAVPR